MNDKYGWTCPKCGRVYAPFVWECAHCNRKAGEAKQSDFRDDTKTLPLTQPEPKDGTFGDKPEGVERDE